MRKLTMKMSLSIDGFVSTLDGDNSWIFKSADPQSKAWSLERTRDTSLILMGRKSFEGMATYWPTAEGPFAEPMNTIPKAVFTRKGYKVPQAPSQTSAARSWAEARVYDGDLLQTIQQLKQEAGKPISALGGAGFMGSLIAAGLIDELHLAIHPIALGAGLPIFAGLTKPLDLRLAETRAFPGGIVVHSYQPT